MKRLKHIKNKNSYCFKYGKLNIKYSDPLSLFYELNDIFLNNIYRFESKKENPKIIDAGGCIGVSTLYFKALYPKSIIYTFEPDLKIFNILKENIRKNAIKDVKLINAGLGEKNEELFFYPDNSDGGTFIPQKKINPIKKDVVRLSDYITEEIDLLKMNIEGYEGIVFKEIEPKLEMIREIILEYHAFDELKQTLGDILNILDRNHFKYLVTDATNAKIPVPFKISKGYRYFNLVYARNILYD